MTTDDLDKDGDPEFSNDMRKEMDDVAATEGTTEHHDVQKSGKSARERIAELTKLRRVAEGSAFEAEMRAVELERRLAERDAAAPVAKKAPDAKDFTYGEVDPAYLDAVVEFKVGEREQGIRSEVEKTARAETEAQTKARYTAKLEEVMKAGEKRYKGFTEQVNKTPFPPDVAFAILNSDTAVDIARHLSNNIAVLREITRATPIERARMIGKLEGRFSVTSAVKKTKAPEPMGSPNRRADTAAEGKYGPDDQDAFDKAFFR